MIVNVRLFAWFADAAGKSYLELEMPDGSSVSDLVSRIRENGSWIPRRPLVAVNLAYASPDQTLAAGDEIALIPPVAGG